MKKFLTFALMIAAVGSMSAQKKNVDAANKLAGKPANVAEARALIAEAAQNPETANDARTYFVGGKVEFDDFDTQLGKLTINPQDPSVDQLAMCENLLNGYRNFVKALPLDSLPNEKGQVKPKYSKDIVNKLNGHFEDYFNAGGTFYNNKKYYPEAYDAFMIYGDIWEAPYASKTVKAVPDSTINMALFNAGVSAYAAEKLPESAAAFKRARKNGSTNPQNYIYEIACWQFLSSRDSNMMEPAQVNIMEIATDGYNKFGMSQPLFLNNIVNQMVLNDKVNDALALIDKQIAETPDFATLYGLRGFVNDRAGNDDASVNDYKKAVALDNVDYETLKNAAKKIFKVGTQKWGNIEGAAVNERADVRKNYFEAAKTITDKAKSDPKAANDGDLNYVIENIDYVLETYFN